MKYFKLISSSLFLLSSLTVLSQNYIGGAGVYRSPENTTATKAQRDAEEKALKKDYEKQKEKMIEESINDLKVELELDELQSIAIRQIIIDGLRIEGIILKKETSDEEKMEALKALSETTDIKVKALLNPKQIEKFTAYRDNPEASKKKKKKKK